LSLEDIQFLAIPDQGEVPFEVTGRCSGNRALLQKALILLCAPEVGGLDPVAVVAQPAAEAVVAGAVGKVSEYLRATYPGTSLSVTSLDISKGRMSMGLTLESGDGQLESTLVTT